VVEVADETEHDGVPLPWRQRTDPRPQVAVGRLGRGERRRLRQQGRVLVRGGASGHPVVVHRAPVRDREEPRAQVPRVGEPGIGRQRLGPRLLGDVVAVAGREGVRETGDVAPVLVDEVLKGREAHDGSTVCRDDV